MTIVHSENRGSLGPVISMKISEELEALLNEVSKLQYRILKEGWDKWTVQISSTNSLGPGNAVKKIQYGTQVNELNKKVKAQCLKDTSSMDETRKIAYKEIVNNRLLDVLESARIRFYNSDKVFPFAPYEEL